jgi:hypothetical protein
MKFWRSSNPSLSPVEDEGTKRESKTIEVLSLVRGEEPAKDDKSIDPIAIDMLSPLGAAPLPKELSLVVEFIVKVINSKKYLGKGSFR